MKKAPLLFLHFWVAIATSVVMLFAVTACENRQTVVEPESSAGEQSTRNVRATATAAVTYTSSPGIGAWTSSTFGTHPYSNCGTFLPKLRVKVISISGDQVTVEIQKLDETAFGKAGFGYIRAAALCGTIANNAGSDRTVQSSSNNKRITFTATFTSGTVQFYPVVILNGGESMYGNPIAIVATAVEPPLAVVQLASKNGGLAYGTVYGTVGGVKVYSNGPTVSLTAYYQCVEFIRRFYREYYNGATISPASVTYAKEFYEKTTMKKYPNGGSTPPQPGDILCFSTANATGNPGHVAIVVSVSSTQVLIAQQNVGGLNHLNYVMNRSGNTLTGMSGLNIQGWIRR